MVWLFIDIVLLTYTSYISTGFFIGHITLYIPLILMLISLSVKHSRRKYIIIYRLTYYSFAFMLFLPVILEYLYYLGIHFYLQFYLLHIYGFITFLYPLNSFLIIILLVITFLYYDIIADATKPVLNTIRIITVILSSIIIIVLCCPNLVNYLFYSRQDPMVTLITVLNSLLPAIYTMPFLANMLFNKKIYINYSTTVRHKNSIDENLIEELLYWHTMYKNNSINTDENNQKREEIIHKHISSFNKYPNQGL